MKSLHIHYKNKYPGGKIESGDDYLEVYDADGAHRVSLHKNGAGQLVCRSEEMGCLDKHDLSPIPKESRLWKLEGAKIVKDDKYDERLESLGQFLKDGKVLSCEDLKKQYRFDDKQQVLEKLK